MPTTARGTHKLFSTSSDVSRIPVSLVREDISKANALDDALAHLCFVATVDQKGNPQLRTLVLREIQGRFGLFLNTTSPKYHEFCNSDFVSVLLYLPLISVQYRMHCRLEPMDVAIVRDSWLLRPRIAKKLDWLYENYRQGSSIPNRDWLTNKLSEIDAEEYAPDSATGFFLDPEVVERLELKNGEEAHDRVRYTKSSDGTWISETLVP